ncbi:argininosuccinate synthase [Kangiella koreensis]|uniref:argininosuccinate synthase n=1 Tax=Kangiella koreensis (strain DSM 16069 / JCM 12317 / KCTC 12182 / SW-125) TaxID=523791 RepID=C7R8V1_KANKD|nr:argininosuccinate synthase [Kangiella koreensis]ACV25964.1 argininosuccinate synthase [Kangiella koreensis DSM 16069]
MSQKKVVLAFSGGLDTSFCVPYLMEKGYEVHTLFVNTGGVSREKCHQIEKRALGLGAKQHWQVDAQQMLWEEIITPLVWGNSKYQGQYPLLCADRYLIVKESIKLCQQLNTNIVAHGCTGMGNDQVRFDISIKALGEYTILSPIRDIQQQVKDVRHYEIEYLQEKGFKTSTEHKKYSINENLLGVTISGSEIDQWQEPQDDTYVLTNHYHDFPEESLKLRIEFKQGQAVAINGEPKTGVEVMQYLNKILGQYGVGRSIYTGDTVIGLKGRIVFEAPALFGLLKAHQAIEEVVLTQWQNQFKPQVADKWTELVYKGFYFDPLCNDLYQFLASTQQHVNGSVELLVYAGQLQVVAVNSPSLLVSKDASYAQTASWGIEEAVGFIQLYGNSTATWAKVMQEQDGAA